MHYIIFLSASFNFYLYLLMSRNKHERDFVLQVRCRDLNNSCDKISTLRGTKAVTNISWDKIATKKIWQSLCNLQDLVYFETSDITKISWYSACKRQMPQKPYFICPHIFKVSWLFWESWVFFENIFFISHFLIFYFLIFYFLIFYSSIFYFLIFYFFIFYFLYFIFFIFFFYIFFISYFFIFYLFIFQVLYFIFLYFIFLYFFFYILFFISYVFIQI